MIHSGTWTHILHPGRFSSTSSLVNLFRTKPSFPRSSEIVGGRTSQIYSSSEWRGWVFHSEDRASEQHCEPGFLSTAGPEDCGCRREMSAAIHNFEEGALQVHAA